MPKARSAEGERREQQLRFGQPCHIRGRSKGWRARGEGDALEGAGEPRFWGNRPRRKGSEKRFSGRKGGEGKSKERGRARTPVKRVGF